MVASEVGSGATHVPVVSTHIAVVVLKEPREDKLVPNNPPRRTSLARLTEALVEPALLARAHDRATRVVPDQINVLIVPSWRVSVLLSLPKRRWKRTE